MIPDLDYADKLFTSTELANADERIKAAEQGFAQRDSRPQGSLLS